jgi:hypothetical protein
MLCSPRTRASFRRAIALTAFACYAGIAIVGYGLHDLVGAHHCYHAPAQHDQGHACSAHAGHDHSVPSEGDSSIALSCDDCAICSLLAQAQSHEILTAPLGVLVPVAPSPVTTEALVSSLRANTSLARGPPTV